MMPRQSIEKFVIYWLPAILLYAVIAWGLWHTPNVLNSMYANHDGMWAAWNTAGILEWGRFLDLSPFNPLSGMGSLFLPNLPSLNPAAAALALPLPRDLTYLISYTLYYAELFISTIVLLRVLGLSPIRSSLAAQLYLLILFPPIGGTFQSLSWYSLAPFNAHLVALANFSLAMFLVLGQSGNVGKHFALAVGIIVLVVVGLFSAPVTFLTYGPVYGLIAVVFLLWQWRDRQMVLWRSSTILILVAILWLIGFVDYLGATAAVSARAAVFPPAFAAGWELLKPAYWLDVWHRFNICGPAEQPLCNQYTIFYVHAAAICGALIQVWRNPAPLRILAALFLIFIVAIEAYAFVSYVFLFGKLHTFSMPYIMWSAYIFFALFAVILVFAPVDLCEHVYEKISSRYTSHDPQRVAAPGRGPSLTWTPNLRWVVVGAVTLVIPVWAYYLSRVSAPYVMWSAYAFFAILAAVFVLAPVDLSRYVYKKISRWSASRNLQTAAPAANHRLLSRVPSLRLIGLAALMMIGPAWAYYLWKVIAPNQPPPPAYKKSIGFLGKSSVREPIVGPITSYLIEHVSLKPGRPFRGYVATYLGDPNGHVRRGVKFDGQRMSVHVYIDARFYFDEHYGNRFQEMDLWEFNIPTLEEYGQWVSKPVYSFITSLFSEAGDSVNPTFLHIYKLDFNWLAALGVRFLITDLKINDNRTTLRAEQDSPKAGPIYLYELANANIATYSPTQTIRVSTFQEAVDAFKLNGKNLEEKVIVFEDLLGHFQKAEKVEMRMERDGFRILAESKGASLIVLPVQFSRCFQIEPVGSTANSTAARPTRANGIQTLVMFEKKLDVLIRFEFGLFGSADCRLEDARDIVRLGIK